MQTVVRFKRNQICHEILTVRGGFFYKLLQISWNPTYMYELKNNSCYKYSLFNVVCTRLEKTRDDEDTVDDKFIPSLAVPRRSSILHSRNGRSANERRCKLSIGENAIIIQDVSTMVNRHGLTRRKKERQRDWRLPTWNVIIIFGEVRMGKF